MPKRRIVGSGSPWVKVISLLLCLLAGCFWRSYPRQAAAQAQLLMAMAHKEVDLVVGGQLTAENMPELTYPLERAGAFVKSATQRAGEAPPASLVALRALCERYRVLLDTLDRVRRSERGEAALARLGVPLAEVDGAVAAVRRALAEEAAR